MTEDTSVFLSDEALGENVLSAQMKVLKGYSSRWEVHSSNLHMYTIMAVSSNCA